MTGPKNSIYTWFFIVKALVEAASKSNHENWEGYTKPIRIKSSSFKVKIPLSKFLCKI